MPDHFRAYLAAGKSSPGVLLTVQKQPIGPVIEALVCVWALSDPEELRDRILHIPSLIVHVFAR
jgi:hypothetical protein